MARTYWRVINEITVFGIGTGNRDLGEVKMKKFIVIAAILLILAPAAWAKNFYPATVLSGGGTGALDKLDGATLADGDVAMVTLIGDGTYGNATFVYVLDADSAAAESVPLVIAPDTNAGDKRWVLTTIRSAAGGSTAEERQDEIGAMFGSNTETGITLTYQDDDGTIDAVVSISTAEVAADTLVTASETIGSNNNDTTLPTSAAVKAYADSVAGAPTNVTPVDTADENATFYPLLVDGATGSQATETDGEFTYNPSTGVMTVPSIVTGSATDPYITLDVTDADDTDWSIGTNADADASSDDDLEFRTSATPGTGVIASLEPDTGILNLTGGIDGIGAIDLDYGSADITDHTFVSDGGTVIIDGTITSAGNDLGSTTAEWDDLFLNDGGIAWFGADQDVRLEHVADTGLLLSDNSGGGTTQLQFGDSGTFINQGADGYLDMTADTGLDLNVGDDGLRLTDGTNEVIVNTGDGMGVTQVNFSALNLVTTGSILGATNVVVTTDGTESPTAAQMYGTMFIADHDTATSDTDYTLPGAAAGMSACFYDNGGGTGGIIIDAASGDEILLNGTGVGAADAIDSPGVAGDGANGDFICLMAIDATSWITLGRSGTWVDGGAD